MLDARTVDMVADLVGPDVKFHHCKINLKLSGAKTEVSYHQDFAYTPHTNDDIVTALLFLDDIDEDNGCLTVVPARTRAGAVAVRWRALHRRRCALRPRNRRWRSRSLASARRRRLPDAHQAAARLGGQPLGRLARPLYLRLHRGGRRADRAQPDAKPQ
jgi:hypothetical protein